MKEIKPIVIQPVEGSAEARQVLDAAIQTGDDLRGLHFIGANININAVGTLEFHDCLFENCRFTENHADKLLFIDVRFEDCDLSNINFNNAVLQRAAFYRSRATGLILSRSNAHQVLFQDCVCRFLNLSVSQWQHAVFERTDLTNAGIQECRLKDVAFTACNMTGTEFFHTPLNGMDFTTDDIAGISVAGGELRGAIVTAYQACELAKLLGVIIRDTYPGNAL